MKLRYLRIRNLPPLQDVQITFARESLLGRACGIHFLAGVNGTGKTRLLLALAEIFIGLEQRRIPEFPITMVYEIGQEAEARIVLLHHAGGAAHRALLRVYRREPDNPSYGDWPEIQAGEFDQYAGSDLPGGGSIGALLPRVVLAYTSGEEIPWQRLVQRMTNGGADQLFVDGASEVDPMRERPPGWSVEQEVALLSDRQSDPETVQRVLRFRREEPRRLPPVGVFVTEEGLKAAVCAVGIAHYVEELEMELMDAPAEAAFLHRIDEAVSSGKRMPGLRGILNAVDWLWPVTLSLQVDVTPGRLFGRRQRQMRELLRLASAAVREPGRARLVTLSFDLRAPAAGTPAAFPLARELMEVLGGEQRTALPFFRELLNWQQERLITDINLIIRKRNVPDLLLYGWLSDGERMFLGRMALLHVLKGTPETLLLLDEPETHFNDIWKREIVDIIDESLGEHPCTVIVTTHSSIALTDAFHTEITLFQKEPESGVVFAQPLQLTSFSAAPNEIMRGVFGASDDVGKRAAEFMEVVLVVASHAESVIKLWRELDSAGVEHSEDFQLLAHEAARALSREGEPSNRDKTQLLAVLRALRKLGRREDGSVSLIDAFSALEEKLGAGFYRFEVRRRIRALSKTEAPETSLG